MIPEVHGPPPPYVPTDNLLLPAVTKKGDVSKLPNITKALPKPKVPDSDVSKSNCAVT